MIKWKNIDKKKTFKYIETFKDDSLESSKKISSRQSDL